MFYFFKKIINNYEEIVSEWTGLIFTAFVHSVDGVCGGSMAACIFWPSCGD